MESKTHNDEFTTFKDISDYTEALTQQALNLRESFLKSMEKVKEKELQISSLKSQLDQNLKKLVSFKFSPVDKPPRWRMSQQLDGNLFTATSRPAFLQKLVDTADPIPEIADFDVYRVDGRSCLQDYSDANFMRMHWIKQEIKKQEQVMRRKKERRKKKKHKTVKEEIQVENITRKVFRADGTVVLVNEKDQVVTEEIPSPIQMENDISAPQPLPESMPSIPLTPISPIVSNLPSIPSIPTVPSTPATKEHEFVEEFPPVIPSIDVTIPKSPYVPSYQEEMFPPEIMTPVEVFSPIDIPPPDLPEVPPLLRVISPVVEERVYEPIKSEMATKIDEVEIEPETKVETVKMHSQEEIKPPELKVTLPPPLTFVPPPKNLETKKTSKTAAPNTRMNLLDSIRKGRELKKVEKVAEKKEEVGDLNASIFMVLQRRAAIVGSDSEEDSDSEEWDD